jgi:hypothetical protein
MVPFKPLKSSYISYPRIAVRGGEVWVVGDAGTVWRLDGNLNLLGTASFGVGSFSHSMDVADDGTAVLWAQGYASGDEGYFFSLLDAKGKPVGTQHKLTKGIPVAPRGAVARGGSGYLAAFGFGCHAAQQFDASGAKVGALLSLPTPCGFDVWGAATSYASGKYVVVYDIEDKSSVDAKTGYTVVDEASAAQVSGEMRMDRNLASSGWVGHFDRAGPARVAVLGAKFGIAAAGRMRWDKTGWWVYFWLIDGKGERLSEALYLGTSGVVEPPVAASSTAFAVARQDTALKLDYVTCK